MKKLFLLLFFLAAFYTPLESFAGNSDYVRRRNVTKRSGTSRTRGSCQGPRKPLLYKQRKVSCDARKKKHYGIHPPYKGFRNCVNMSQLRSGRDGRACGTGRKNCHTRTGSRTVAGRSTSGCAIAGKCGSPNGGIGTSKPSSRSCSVGGRSGLSYKTTPTPRWVWTCKGINGGNTPTCSYRIRINGSCSNLDGTKSYTPPASVSSILCDNAEPSATTISYDPINFKWTRTCKGHNGGSYASCEVRKNIDGQCSAANNSCTNEGGDKSYVSYNPSTPAVPNNTKDPSNNISDSIDGGRRCNGINDGEDMTCDEHTWISYDIGDRSICGNLSHWTAEKATCDQTRTITPVIKKSYGEFDITTPEDEQRPGDGRTVTISLDLDLENSTCDDVTEFADNIDTCNLRIKVNDVPAEGIVGLEGQVANSFDYSDVYLDQVDKTGATTEITIPGSSITKASTTNYYIDVDGIRSTVPFVYNDPFDANTGDMTFNLSGDVMAFNNVPVGFRKPYLGDLTIPANNDEIILETVQTTQLDVLVSSGADTSGISNRSISNFVNTLQTTNTNYVVAKTGAVNIIDSNPTVETRVYLAENAIVGESGLKTYPYVSYNLGGDNVRYHLNPSDNPENEDAWINLNEQEFVGVKVVGLYQGEGKLYNSGEEENNSDVSSIEYRNLIKRNAEVLIRDMNSGEIQGGVYYHEGDITLPGTINFDDVNTIIVKDGNVTIDSNITPTNSSGDSKFIGIIALGDYYSDPSKANIFVEPQVSIINAAMYADGGLISLWSGQTGIAGYADSTARTESLQNQLVLKGTLVTRNTIGGALDAGSDYILPGGSTTTNYNLAMMYDLNYVRRGSDNLVSTENQGFENPFVIVHDSRITTNPPAGFAED